MTSRTPRASSSAVPAAFPPSSSRRRRPVSGTPLAAGASGAGSSAAALALAPDVDPRAPQVLMLQISLSELARAERAGATPAPSMPFRVVAQSAAGDVVRYQVFAPARARNVVGPPPNTPELFVRNAAGVDLWRTRSGRDVREKYLAKPGRDYRYQVVVQTWLKSLPKRVLVLALKGGTKVGEPVLLIHGDAMGRRFSIESIETAAQAARVKRMTRFETMTDERSPGKKFNMEIHEWEIKIHPKYDAALISAFTCLLEGFVSALGGGTAMSFMPSSRRSGRHGRTHSEETFDGLEATSHLPSPRGGVPPVRSMTRSQSDNTVSTAAEQPE